MSTVAHTILEFGPEVAIKMPTPLSRRIVVSITASYVVDGIEDTKVIEEAIQNALSNLYLGVDTREEEPSARVEIHNIPEEPGT